MDEMTPLKIGREEYLRERVQNRRYVGDIVLKNLRICIENPSYTYRRGVALDGTGWESLLQNAYGFLPGCIGADGAEMDLFLGPDIESDIVFVINQNVLSMPDIFDETKVMLGFSNALQAANAYRANYSEGWSCLGSVSTLPWIGFINWLENADKSLPCPGGEPIEMLAAAPAAEEGLTDAAAWPLDTPKHVHAALGYYNQTGARHDKMVSNYDGSWATLGKKIAAAASKLYGKVYSVIEGKVQEKKTEAEGDTSLVGNPGVVQVTSSNPTEESQDGSKKLSAGQDFIDEDSAGPTNDDDDEDDGSAETDSLEGGESIEWVFSPGDDYVVLTDSKGVMRVKQLAMVVEPQINLNGRFIPRAVAKHALAEVDKRARRGLVLTELSHPKIVANMDGGDAFVDNYDRKTGQIDRVYQPDVEGNVYVERTIQDNNDCPAGKAVADRFRQKNPDGLSTRMLVKHHPAVVRGQQVQYFDKFKISTWDDMAKNEAPAVPESRRNYTLLTDEMRKDLQMSNSVEGVTDKAAGVTTASKPKGTTARMNEKIKAALDELREVVLHADPTDKKGNLARYAKAKKAVVDTLSAARIADAAIDTHAPFKELGEVDTMMQMSGLFSNRPGPMATPGNMTSDSGDTGTEFASDLLENSKPLTEDQMQDGHTTPPKFKGDGIDGDAGKRPDATQDATATATMEDKDKADTDTFLQELKQERQAKKAEIDRSKAVSDAIEAKKDDILKGLSDEDQTAIIDVITKTAPNAEMAITMMQAQADVVGRVAARERLASQGYTVGNETTRVGSTNDPASGQFTGGNAVKAQEPAYMQTVHKLLAASDDYSRRFSNSKIDPDDDHTIALRKHTRHHFVEPLVNQMLQLRRKAGTVGEFQSMLDSFEDDGEKALTDAWDRWGAQGDSNVTISSFYNQPTVSIALIYQMFQDLTGLQWVDGLGPGEATQANWTQTKSGYSNGTTGWILAVPLETYGAPTGAGTYQYRSFDPYDAGLLVAENQTIPTGSTSIYWANFAVLPRMIATTITRQVRAAAGLGPLNYDEIGRNLYNIGADKNRRIDKALYDEMLLTSDEYGMVNVVNESVNLTNNSVYSASGSPTVNLNPNKSASTTPTGSDPYFQYGANVLGVVRLACGASGYTTNTLCGTQYGVTPVLPPRTVANLQGVNGAYQVVQNHLLSILAPANAVMGYIDSTQQVQTYPQTWGQASAPSAATYAVEWETGCVVFTSGVSGTGTILTTAVNATYWYATNFDNFICLAGGNANVFSPITDAQVYTLTNGTNKSLYFNELVGQTQITAALMGSPPTFSKANLVLGNLNLMSLVLTSQMLAPLYTPKGTDFYPAPDIVADNVGLKFGRHNSPWQAGSRRLLEGRRGATKYGVGIPAQVTGPYPSYGVSGSGTSGIIPNDTFYIEEYSTIATPIVTATDGVTTYNPPYRTILARGPVGA